MTWQEAIYTIHYHHPGVDWNKERYHSDPDYREKILAHNREYNRKHRNQILVYRKNRYHTNPRYREKQLTRVKAYNQKYSERILAYQRAYSKGKYRTNPEYREKRLVQNRENARIYLAKPENKLRMKELQRRYLREAWEEVFKVYGRVCACCGESNSAFLTLDHKNGDGREDRHMISGRKSDSGASYRVLYEAARQADHDKYQILCFNCNCGRARDKGNVCPHDESYEDLRSQRAIRVQEELFRIYGRECVCCGESNPGFLVLDHKKGNGKRDRKNRSENKILIEAIKYPDYELYQVLCFNCNSGRHRYKNKNGVCPHKVTSNL